MPGELHVDEEEVGLQLSELTEGDLGVIAASTDFQAFDRGDVFLS